MLRDVFYDLHLIRNKLKFSTFGKIKSIDETF